MQVYEDLIYINRASLAFGFFDGVHPGHKAVLNNAVKTARENNVQSAVITFKTHPLNFLSKNPPKMILTLEERLEKIEETGIDNVFLLDFRKYASMKAEDYLKNVIVKYFSPIAASAGYNHSFGADKEGNSCFLKKYAEKYGFKYYEIPPLMIGDKAASSSLARNMISLGDFYNVSKLLGYDFFIRGRVIHGDNIASKLGFPSANIIYPKNKIEIPFGVYYTRVKISNTDKEYDGILNYGSSFRYNINKIKTEVHIIDFSGDIYGENIQISFIAKIRNLMNFENTEKLKQQLSRDKAFAGIYGRFAFKN